jgi:hypothetical protein
MENTYTPSFKGCYPEYEEWLDDDTFIIYFADRRDRLESLDGEVTNTINTLFAEVHTDEDNAVVIGENVYESKTTDYIDTFYHCIGNEIRNEIEMDDKTANEIKEYALAKMKTYM